MNRGLMSSKSFDKLPIVSFDNVVYGWPILEWIFFSVLYLPSLEMCMESFLIYSCHSNRTPPHFQQPQNVQAEEASCFSSRERRLRGDFKYIFVYHPNFSGLTTSHFQPSSPPFFWPYFFHTHLKNLKNWLMWRGILAEMVASFQVDKMSKQQVK